MGSKHHRWRHWSSGGYGNFAVAKENVASKGTTPDLSMGAFSPAVPWKFDFCINTWVPRGRIRPTWAIGAITVLDDASSSIPFTSGTIRTRCSGRCSSRSNVSITLFQQVSFPLASIREKWNFYFEEEGVGISFLEEIWSWLFIFDTFTATHLMKT